MGRNLFFIALSVTAISISLKCLALEPIIQSESCDVKNPETGAGRGYPGVSMSSPRYSADDKKLYVLSKHGLKENDNWDLKVFEGENIADNWITKTPRNELAVLPSPIEGKLLLLVEDMDNAALLLTDTKANELCRLPEALDLQRSQFAWSHDGKSIYVSLPVKNGKGMMLKKFDENLKESSVIKPDGVNEFDVCRTRDRIVILSDKTIFLRDEKGKSTSFEQKEPIKHIRISPDSEKIVFSNGSIVVMSFDGKIEGFHGSAPEKKERTTDEQPVWAPDSKRLVFERVYYLGSKSGPVLNSQSVILDIYSGAEKELDRPWCIRHGDMQWSPSGKQILSLSIYLTNPKATKIDIPSPPELLPAYDKAKWTPTNGPFGGYMDAFIISPKDENVVYAAIGGNLYVTKDGGENWRILRNKNSLRFRDIGFGAEETGVIYGLGGGHLVRSDDEGETWETFGPRDEIKNLEAIAPHPKTPGVVLALLSDEKTVVLYDKDSVRTLGVIEDKIGYEKLIIDRNNPDIVIEKDSYKLHVFSIDGGKTWNKVEPPKGEKSVSFIAGDKSNKSIIYAETGSEEFFTQMMAETHGIYMQIQKIMPSGPTRYRKPFRNCSPFRQMSNKEKFSKDIISGRRCLQSRLHRIARGYICRLIEKAYFVQTMEVPHGNQRIMVLAEKQYMP